MSSTNPNPPAADGDPLAGTKYKVLGRLGEGGMGEVYLVEHRVLGTEVVAKLLRPEFAKDAGVVERMRVEAQSLAALSHRNIVSVTDLGKTAAGRPFYVMERLDGETIGQRLRRDGPPPLEESLEIAHQVLDALAVAHALGLIHRDIKPDNVFLHRDRAGRQVVKLLDFGIAKVSANAAGAPTPSAIPTAEGAIIGTPRYISPEQILGKVVDHRADIYAVGLLLYALVNGEGPFDHLRTTGDLFEAQLKMLPPPLSTKSPRVSPELDRAVQRALAKRPDDRFQHASEFSAALAAVDLTASPAAASQPRRQPAQPEPGKSVGSMDTLLSPAGAQANPFPQRAARADLPQRVAHHPDQTVRDAAPGPAASMQPAHGAKQTFRELVPPRTSGSEPAARDVTEPLPAPARPSAGALASTRSARPGQLNVAQAGGHAASFDPSATARSSGSALPAYVAAAVSAALLMSVVVFGLGLRSMPMLLAAMVLSAVVGTGLATGMARRPS